MNRLRDRLSESRIPEILPMLKVVVTFPFIVILGFLIQNLWSGEFSILPSNQSRTWLFNYWWIAVIITVLVATTAVLSWWAGQGRIDPSLLQAAKVKRASSVRLGVGPDGGDILIPEFNGSVYLVREAVETTAQETLAKNHALILRGRAQCGKTRIAANIMCSNPRAFVIQPQAEKPPVFSNRGVGKDRVYLFLDDLHAQVGRIDAQLWWDRIRETWHEQAFVIATVWPGEEWDNVTRSMQGFVRAVSGSIVDATPFSEEEGRRLHALLGLETNFELRWDGTPGGLAIGLDAYKRRYRELKAIRFDGVRGHWLLDAARILTDAGMFRLKESTIRSVVELIVNQRKISNDQWRELKERTSEKGFGDFDAGIFATYSSYVSGSSVVDFVPAEDDFRQVGPILGKEQDWAALVSYAVRAYRRFKLLDVASDAFEQAIRAPGGRVPYTLGNYAHFLTFILGDHDHAEEVYRTALSEFPASSMLQGLYAQFLSNVRHENDEAEKRFKSALRSPDKNSLGVLTNFAIFLAEVRHDNEAAERVFQRAEEIDPENSYMLHNYGRFLIETSRCTERGYELLNHAEEIYVRAIKSNPNNADNYCHYALFLESMKSEYQLAEHYYRRALAIDPIDLNARATLAGLLLAQDKVNEGYEELDRALRLNLQAEPIALSVELSFYRIVYYRSQKEKMIAIREMRSLIRTGGRSLRWDFSKHVRHAELNGHEDAEWINRLAEVISRDVSVAPLEDWPAWRNAN